MVAAFLRPADGRSLDGALSQTARAILWKAPVTPQDPRNRGGDGLWWVMKYTGILQHEIRVSVCLVAFPAAFHVSPLRLGLAGASTTPAFPPDGLRASMGVLPLHASAS